MPSTTLEPHALDVLAGTPAALRAMLGALPDHAVETPAGEGWSPRDVVAHRVSTEGAAFQERAHAIIDGDRPSIANYDEEEQLERSGLRKRPLRELLDAFEGLRERSLSVLRSLSDADFAKLADHEVAGDISLADLVHHRAYHDTLHIAQVATMLQDRLDPLRGNMRTF